MNQDENFQRYGTEAPAQQFVNQPVINGGRGDLATQAAQQSATVVDRPNPSVPTIPGMNKGTQPITVDELTKLAAEISQFVEEARVRAGRIYANLTGYEHAANTEIEKTVSSNISGILNHIRDETTRLHSILHSL